MMTPIRLLMAAGVLLSIVGGTPEGLAAQDPIPDTTRLPTMEVTATRSRRSVMEQPLAMTHLPRSSFQDGSGYRLDEALTFVPGVVARSRYGTSDIQILIRGYGARGAGERSNAGTSRGVRVLVDGFPETEPDGRTSFDAIDLASVSSIDVIRSNASSIWGNAAGGVVHITTDAPVTDPYATAETVVGSAGLRRLAGRSGWRVGSGQLTASATRTVFEGWRAHSNSDRTLGTLSWRAPVGSRTNLGLFAYGVDHTFRVPGPLTAEQVEADPDQANATFVARNERRENRLARLGVRVTHQLSPNLELSGMTFGMLKRLNRSERNTFRDFDRYHVGGNAMLRWTRESGGVEHALTVGVDEAYQDGDIRFWTLSPSGGQGDRLTTNKREAANNAGAFVQEELSLGRWDLSLGLRFDAITYTVEDFLDRQLSDTRTLSGVTPKLGVNFRPTPFQSLYASVGGGIEAPAGNETDPPSTFGEDTVFALNPLLEPIRSTTVEVGYRTITPIGGAILRTDFALYRTSVRNEVIPLQGGRFFLTAGRVRREGLEFGADLTAGRFTAQGSLALSRHRYREYLVDSVHYGRPGQVADFAGNTLVGVPWATWALGAGYRVRALAGLQARATVRGNSSFWADDANLVRVPAWRTADLTLTLPEAVSLGGGLGVRGSVTVSNLFDSRYIGSAFLNPPVVDGVPVAFEPAAPRQLLVSFSLGQFGSVD